MGWIRDQGSGKTYPVSRGQGSRIRNTELGGNCAMKSFFLVSGGSHLSEREPLDQKPNIQFTDSTVLSHLQL
jgi:hypothetical protein